MVLSNNRANFRSMKKYLLLLLCVVALAGCRLDEAGFPKEGEISILGKWYNKSTTTFTPAQNGVPANSYTFTTFTANDYISFTSNIATKSESFSDIVTPYKYTLAGSTLSLTSDAFPGEVDIQTITKLTADSLVLTSNGSAIGGPITTTFIVTERYARK